MAKKSSAANTPEFSKGKTMKLKIILCILFNVFLLSVLAQTNAPDLSKMPYHPYRKVNDKIYSIQPIYDWMKLPKSNRSARPMREWEGVAKHSMYGLYYKVVQVLPDGLLAISSGEFLIGVEHPDFSSWKPIFLKNYPLKNLCIDDQAIRFIALRTGNYQYTNTAGAVSTVALYDYGEVVAAPQPREPTSEQLAACKQIEDTKRQSIEAKAVKYNQDLADKGDAYGQLRMGERYLIGDGVEKDEAKAREFLTKSAAQGNKDAANALEKLKNAKP